MCRYKCFLTTPGVNHLSGVFVTAMIWYHKTFWFSGKVGLMWIWCRQGCSAPQDSPGFSALSSVTEMPSAGCMVLAVITICRCVKCCTRRERCGRMIWQMHLWEVSCLLVFCPYARTCRLHFQYSLWILGRNKVKNLLYIVLAPLSFRKAES